MRSQEKVLTVPWGRADFHRWWGGWCESHLNLQTKQREHWGRTGDSNWQGHQQHILPTAPAPLSLPWGCRNIPLQHWGMFPLPGPARCPHGSCMEKPVAPSHCSNRLPDCLGLQVHFVPLASPISYSFLLYLFSAYLPISNLADICTNAYACVHTSPWFRSNLYVYRPDLVLAIAQLWEIGLDLQKFLPANISVIFTLLYVHHYTWFSSCRYHFV